MISFEEAVEQYLLKHGEVRPKEGYWEISDLSVQHSGGYTTDSGTYYEADTWVHYRESWHGRDGRKVSKRRKVLLLDVGEDPHKLTQELFEIAADYDEWRQDLLAYVVLVS